MIKLSVILLIFTLSLWFVSDTLASKVIIVEDARACFRRAIAGKRVVAQFIKKSVPCENLADCQRECSDEKKFDCEGFNYRLDQRGHGKGVCELIELPLSRLDIGRDLIPDRDYDFYEKDRDNISPDCRPSYGKYPGDNTLYPPSYPSGSGGDHYGPWDRPEPPRDDRYPRPQRPSYEVDHYRPTGYDNRYDYPSYRPQSRPEYGPTSYEPYLPSRDYYDYDRYYPEKYPDYGGYVDDRRFWYRPDKKKYFNDREKDRNYWGLDHNQGYPQNHWASYGGSYGNFGRPESDYGWTYDYNAKPGSGYDTNKWYPTFEDFRKNTNFIPYRIGLGDRYRPPPNWGQYGGNYGSNKVDMDSFNYWGLNRDKYNYRGSAEERPYGYVLNRFEPPKDGGYSGVISNRRPWGSWSSYGGTGPSGPSGPPGLSGPSGPSGPTGPQSSGYPFPGHNEHFTPTYGAFGGGMHSKYDCSIRSGSGIRLQNDLVKKFFSVDSIYECEHLCFMEKHFTCYSYSFRYARISEPQAENCYLSDRPFGEINMYRDTEPDKNFDIYAMNQDREKHCMQPDHDYGSQSDCFWRTRSGQRLDKQVVKDSIDVKSIGQCELECIKASKFVCRSFSFRYGSPVIGGLLENCQLTDWSYKDLDPTIHLVPDPAYELYERGSYGHGCEANVFLVIGPNADPHLNNLIPTENDKECYIGYGRPARLLPRAIRKSIPVVTESECKAACTQNQDFCMSFSFRSTTSALNRERSLPLNCDLSDVNHRDLRLNLDYAHDPDYWLFAWDTFNPKCRTINSGPPPVRPSGPNSYLPEVYRPDRYRPSRPYGPTSSGSYFPDSTGPGYRPAGPAYRPTGPSGSDYHRPTGPSGSDYHRPAGPSGSEYYRPTGPYRPSYYEPDSIHPSGPDSYGSSRPNSYGPDRPRPSRPQRPEFYPPTSQAYPSAPASVNDMDRYDYGFDFGPDAWQHYTVKGYPCRKGSKCEKNVVAGYWSCEIEGGEVGSWDYCCRPSHQCGYSEGFDYPWCYVGPEREQWRKCNDRYYPYGAPQRPAPISQHYASEPRPSFTNTWANKPMVSLESQHRPWLPHSGSHNIDRFESSEVLNPPRPGGLGEPRYWPVAYLHKESPPSENTTNSRNWNKPSSYKPSSSPQNRTTTPKSKSIEAKIAQNQNGTEYLGYEVLNNDDINKAAQNSKIKLDNNDDLNNFETVDNVTDDIFSETDKKEVTTVLPIVNKTETEKVKESQKRRRDNRGRQGRQGRTDRLFVTGSGNLPSQIRQEMFDRRI